MFAPCSVRAACGWGYAQLLESVKPAASNGCLYCRDGSGVVVCVWSQGSESVKLEAGQCVSNTIVNSTYVLQCESEIVSGCCEKQNSDQVH